MNDTTPLDTTPQPEPAPRRGVLRPILIGVGSAVAVLALGVGGFAIADEIGDSSDDPIVITSSDRPATTSSDDDSDDDSSSAPSTAPSPSSSWSSSSDGPISDAEYAEVSAAALAAVGGGTVTELTRDDDPGKAWEVEIRLDNGDEAEVELAADLSVLRIDLDRNDD
ncbi:hypothetical protein [Pseudolysinimonas sp.]|jgi:hypothetical protein|uniref:hypothetical protein n=1 Tax=Pseudolysinimonas sp. TaxID=2680009 RepID=UPI00378350F9